MRASESERASVPTVERASERVREKRCWSVGEGRYGVRSQNRETERQSLCL